MSVLRAWARALGGDFVGSQILCPGPGHGPRDRSLSVRISATAPEGFLAFSHAGDDFPTCRDYVKARLGIDRAPRENRPQTPRSPAPPPPGDDDRTGPALALWRASVPRAPLVERYLTARGLELGDDIAGEVLRWNARIGAMIGLFRNVETDEPQAVSRTYLDAEGRKLERKFLGPVGGAAIKLDDDSEVLGGLHVAEGIETAMSARMLGLKPAWAVGSASAVAAFPVLNGVKTITFLTERCAVNARAVETCAARWHAAGRDVIINEPKSGKDLNDAIRRLA